MKNIKYFFFFTTLEYFWRFSTSKSIIAFENDHFHPIFIILRFIAKYSISFISTSVGLTWSFIQMIQPSTHCYLAILALSNSFQGRNWLCKKQSLVQPLYKLTPTFIDLRTAQLQIISKLWHRSFYNPKCLSVGRSDGPSKKMFDMKKTFSGHKLYI